MKAYLINDNNFYSQYAIFDEEKRTIAIVKVENESKLCYEVVMLDKSPAYLLPVYDFIRVNWR